MRAALVDPVPRDHTEPDSAFRRRRVVVAVTLLVGAGVLTWAFRIEPGDSLFYVATLVLAGVWAVGALLSGPLHLGRARTRSGELSGRAVVQSLALGCSCWLSSSSGSVVVARVPFLRDPVDELLDHAQFGSLALVAVITAVNGIAEELYFRGALYAGVGRRHAVLVTTVVYALVVATSGIPLLSSPPPCSAGRRSPTPRHRWHPRPDRHPPDWSLGMLFLLPHALAAFA